MRGSWTLRALLSGVALGIGLQFVRPFEAAFVATLVAVRYFFFSTIARTALSVSRTEAAIARDPTRADLYFDLAVSLATRGRLAEATTVFRQGVGLDPSLDIERPADLTLSLLERRGYRPDERRILSFLVSAALVDRVIEAGASDVFLEPLGSSSPLALTGEARSAFIDQCEKTIESLGVEISGLEQLRGNVEFFVPEADVPAERERIDAELRRLKSETDEIAEKLRQIRGG